MVRIEKVRALIEAYTKHMFCFYEFTDITIAGNSLTNRKALIDELQTKLENSKNSQKNPLNFY